MKKSVTFVRLGTPIGIIGGLFCLKWVLYLWEPKLAEMGILSTVNILWLGIGIGFAFALPLSSYIWSEFLEDPKQRTAGSFIVGVSLLLVSGYVVALYSTKIYPALPPGLGGGRLESAIIWVKKQNLPPVKEMQQRLPEANLSAHDVIVEGGNVHFVRIAGAPTLLVGKNLILSGTSGENTKGIVLPSESVKMLAWGPQ